MFALFIQASVMLAIIGSFLQSRRITESSVLHAAATAMLYGIIEQVKELDYTTLLPNSEIDPAAPTGPGAPVPPYVRIRINQGTIKWLTVVYTRADEAHAWNAKAPATTPAITASAADVGAVDNFIGDIPLSTVTGSTSQTINLNIWVWVDEIGRSGTWSEEATPPKVEATDVKKVTLVYTYDFQDGGKTRRVRDREVFIRTRYDQ